MHNLTIEKREGGKNLEELRETGKIPAVFYGKKEASTPISLDARQFVKVWKEAGESSIITLTGIGEDKEVLIKEIDFEPLKNSVRHVDFYAIEKGKKVRVSVPLEFIGTPPAEKAGAALMKVLHEVEIEAFPKDLPHEIEVDISVLTEAGSQILAGDIKLPSGVDLITEPEEVVALASEIKEEVEGETPADMSAIELSEERGKKEEEGEEAAE
jgi:large subunit ribosomal protein L25